MASAFPTLSLVSLTIYYFARTAGVDGVLVLCLMLTQLAILAALDQPRLWRWVGVAACAAIMTKGPAAAIPLVGMFAALLVAKPRPPARHLGAAVRVTALVALPTSASHPISSRPTRASIGSSTSHSAKIWRPASKYCGRTARSRRTRPTPCTSLVSLSTLSRGRTRRCSSSSCSPCPSRHTSSRQPRSSGRSRRGSEAPRRYARAPRAHCACSRGHGDRARGQGDRRRRRRILTC